MLTPQENKLAMLDEKIKVDTERLSKELDIKPLAAKKRWDRYKLDLKKATATAVVVPKKLAVKSKDKNRAPTAADEDDTVDEVATVDKPVAYKKNVRRGKKAKVEGKEDAEDTSE
jgi:hypothetical protein